MNPLRHRRRWSRRWVKWARVCWWANSEATLRVTQSTRMTRGLRRWKSRSASRRWVSRISCYGVINSLTLSLHPLLLSITLLWLILDSKRDHEKQFYEIFWLELSPPSWRAKMKKNRNECRKLFRSSTDPTTTLFILKQTTKKTPKLFSFSFWMNS